MNINLDVVLETIFDKIANNEHTEQDLLFLRMLLVLGNNNVNVIRQLGKYNVNLSEGKEIHIGDRIYLEWSEEAFQQLFQTITLESNRNKSSKSYETISILFESTPKYPFLKFSIINRYEEPIQITSIDVVKAATIKYKRSSTKHIVGARMKIDCWLNNIPIGSKNNIFGDDLVSNLKPGEAEAFQLKFVAENTLNLIELNIEYILPSLDTVQRYFSPYMIVVMTPSNDGFSSYNNDGKIYVISRESALNCLLNDEDTEFELLYRRGAGFLSRINLQENWHKLLQQYEDRIKFGPILASFAEVNIETKDSLIFEYLQNWVKNPQKVGSIMKWDTEVHSVIVLEALLTHLTNNEIKTEFLLEVIDNTLCLDTSLIEEESKKDGMESFISSQKRFSLNYLWHTSLLLLAEINGKKILDYLNAIEKTKLILDYTISSAWSKAYENDNTDLYFEWQSKSPRIAKLNQICQIKSINEALLLTSDSDPLVRYVLLFNEEIKDKHIIIEKLAQDPIDLIRVEIARNPNTQDQVLSRLSYDQNSFVRRWVATHLNSNIETLERLANDNNTEVIRFLVNRPKCPQSVLVKLSGCKNPEIANKAKGILGL